MLRCWRKCDNSFTVLRLRVLVIAVVAAVAVGLYFLDPSQYIFMPKCPFKLLTGLSCPGCGAQRALHALLHGNVVAAVRYNWFLVYAVPYATALVMQRLAFTGELQRRLGDILECRWLVNFYLVAFCVWFVVRNIWEI